VQQPDGVPLSHALGFGPRQATGLRQGWLAARMPSPIDASRMTIPARITVTAPIATIETLSQGGGCLATPTPISKAPTSNSANARIVINVDGGLKIQQRGDT